MYYPGCCDVAYVDGKAANEITGTNLYDGMDVVQIFDCDVMYFDFLIFYN